MRITVLLGGVSAERQVSLSSGLRIAIALREHGHDVICLDPAEGVLTRETERTLLAAGVGSAPPSPDSIPNNHLAYAIQWFLFAGFAAVIYFLALKRRERDAGAANG